MKTLNYLMLLSVLFGIASCYYIRAPYRISSSGLPPRPIGLFRPLRQRLFPGSTLPRMTTITRGRRIAPPLTLGRRISSGRIGGSISDLGRSIPFRRIGGSISNNNDENNNNIGRRIGVSRFQSNNINNNNLRIRPSIGSSRLFSLSAPPPIVPRQIRYLFDSRPRISGTSSVRRISSSRRISPSRLRFPSRLSTTSLRRISTRQGQIPGIRTSDQVMALFAVDGPRGAGDKTSSIQGQGLSKLPLPAEMVAKSTSVRRIGKKASKVGGFRTSKSRTTSKVAGAQIKKSKIIKKEVKTTKTKLTVPEAKIVESKIKTQEPIVVPAAIIPTETKAKAVVKQDIKISDADTVNIKTAAGVKATEKAQPVLIKEQHGSGLDIKSSKVETSQPILKKDTAVAKSTLKSSKEASPIKAGIGLTKGRADSKIKKVVAESAAVPVIIPETKGKIAETSVKSNIKINDADTVNIKTGAVASSGEVTGGIKTAGKQAVIVPEAVSTDKTKVVVPAAVTIDKKEVVAAKTAVTDIKKVAGKVLADKKTVITDKAVIAPDTKGHVHVH